MADDSDRDWKKLFGAAGRPSAKGPCPPPDSLSSSAGGASAPEALAHLSECASCREDLIIHKRQQAQKTERGSLELRNRLYALQARKPHRAVWIAAAAAILLVAASLVILRSPEPTPAPVVAIPARPKEKRALPEPRPEVPEALPEPPKPAPPRPKPPALPERIPPPLPPKPEPPDTVPPVPAPEKPAPAVPAPEKPAPEPTRAAQKGMLVAVAGSCLVQAEGDAATQLLRSGQRREFPGTVRLKADAAPTKAAVGPVTYYLQRGAELSIQLLEGRTRVQLSRGEAFFDVTPGSGGFDVETAHGKVTVNGTRFLVSSEKSETEVAVQRGTVDFSAAGESVALSPGERSTAAIRKAPIPAQKADLARRLSWVRNLEDFLWIEGEQMALQGGMAILQDATASGGRAIGVKDPLKPGVEAAAEIRARHKQGVPYAVWIRLSWPHNVPSALSLAVGDNLHWTSKDVVPAPGWQWVRAGSGELSEDPFRIRFTDAKVGLKVDQILVTSDQDFNPDTDKR